MNRESGSFFWRAYARRWTWQGGQSVPTSLSAATPGTSHLVHSAGFTLIELLMVIAIVGILASIMINFLPLQRQANDEARAVAATIKAARTRAMSSTKAVQVKVVKATGAVTVKRADNCDATTWTSLSESDYFLSKGTQFTTNDRTICFDSRGLADTTTNIVIMDRQKKSATINVFLGGAIKVSS